MAQSFANGDKEIWESTIEGRISVEVLNSRHRPQTLSILGKGSRLRLSTEERTLVEEGVRTEQNNPFRNGMLVQVGGVIDPESATNEQNLTDVELGALFELKDSDFEDAVRVLSQVNVRRLLLMVPAMDAAKSQSDFLTSHIEEMWPIGADTPSNAEARGDRTVTI